MSGKLYKVEEQYFNNYQIIAFIASGYGLWKLAKEKENGKVLLPMIFLGGFVFHIVWETKAIYVIQYYFLLIPYMAFGMVKGKDLISEKIGIIYQKKCRKMKNIMKPYKKS